MKSYRSLKAELEDVLEKLQDPGIDLDEANKIHDQGKKLIAELSKYLASVEQKVKKPKS